MDWNKILLLPCSSTTLSPSLRGSGLKSPTALCKSVRLGSPSLRGSGLKSKYDKNGKLVKNVSLFTREWIEIQNARITQHPRFKSPSLRGSGLKFAISEQFARNQMSPSLRGSGLKSISGGISGINTSVSLFTREWIEIQPHKGTHSNCNPSPSLRGSGLKSVVKTCKPLLQGSPSLRGRGLKSVHLRNLLLFRWSPSLRGSGLKFVLVCEALASVHRLPLYEGVDWNFISQLDAQKEKKSPSLRGSGLKYRALQKAALWGWSPSLRGSGLRACVHSKKVV